MNILPSLERELSLAARRLDRDRGSTRRGRRLGRRSLLAVPIAVVALGGLALAAVRTLDRPFAGNQYRYGACPRDVVALGPDALGAARRAAVAQAHVAYPGRARGARSTGARIVTPRSPRSEDARRCGLLGRTVLVELRLPSGLPSASLSEGSVYVSRVRPRGGSARYLLWGLEH